MPPLPGPWGPRGNRGARPGRDQDGVRTGADAGALGVQGALSACPACRVGCHGFRKTQTNPGPPHPQDLLSSRVTQETSMLGPTPGGCPWDVEQGHRLGGAASLEAAGRPPPPGQPEGPRGRGLQALAAGGRLLIPPGPESRRKGGLSPARPPHSEPFHHFGKEKSAKPRLRLQMRLNLLPTTSRQHN